MANGSTMKIEEAVNSIFEKLNDIKDTQSRQDENIKSIKDDIKEIKDKQSELSSEANQNRNSINLIEQAMQDKVSRSECYKSHQDIVAVDNKIDNHIKEADKTDANKKFGVTNTIAIVIAIGSMLVTIASNFIR